MRHVAYRLTLRFAQALDGLAGRCMTLPHMRTHNVGTVYECPKCDRREAL